MLSWMTDDKKTKEILAKRLKINDQEILDETYTAYEKLTEKKPYPTLKASSSRSKTWPRSTPRRKGQSPEISSISPC